MSDGSQSRSAAAWMPTREKWATEFLARAQRGGLWYVVVSYLVLFVGPGLPLAAAASALTVLALLAGARFWCGAKGQARHVAWLAYAQAALFGALCASQLWIAPQLQEVALCLLFLGAVAAAGHAALAVPPGRLLVWLACLLAPSVAVLVVQQPPQWVALSVSIVLFAGYLLLLGRRLRKLLAHTWFTEHRLMQAGEQKRTLVAHLSHDLRTPLSTVVGYLDLAQHDASVNDRGRFIRTARHQLMNSIEMLNHLLNIAKTDIRHESWELREFSPRELFDETCEVYAGDFESADRELICESGLSTGVRCLGSRVALYRALCNGLSNASRHVPTGPVRARIELVEVSLRRFALQVDVFDTGPGLPPPAHAVLRAVDAGEHPSEIRSSADGDGLGLRGTALMLRSLGGALRSTRTDDGEHRVRVLLPVNPVREEVEAPQARTAEAKAAAKAAGEPN